MKPVTFFALAMGALGVVPASAEPMSLQSERYARVAPDYATPRQPQQAGYAAADPRPELGGGFIEFLFGGGRPVARPRAAAEVAYAAPGVPARPALDPKYEKQVVAYSGHEKPGTIIIDTPERFLFLVQGDGTALRYGIGVGKPGFTWAGMKTITAKKEWPDWRPPQEMLHRRPDLPTFMAGGIENPLGARAMYLGSTLYRIHGSNEPWTIGTAVSSGCIRMRNEDVVDLYDRVKVGSKVLVI
jgi:lipoprotein-anchoring transpeptidase ErfK/SrfK